MEMKIPQQALVVALARGIVMDSVTDNEKPKSSCSKNFIKFAEIMRYFIGFPIMVLRFWLSNSANEISVQEN